MRKQTLVWACHKLQLCNRHCTNLKQFNLNVAGDRTWHSEELSEHNHPLQVLCQLAWSSPCTWPQPIGWAFHMKWWQSSALEEDHLHPYTTKIFSLLMNFLLLMLSDMIVQPSWSLPAWQGWRNSFSGWKCQYGRILFPQKDRMKMKTYSCKRGSTELKLDRVQLILPSYCFQLCKLRDGEGIYRN